MSSASSKPSSLNTLLFFGIILGFLLLFTSTISVVRSQSAPPDTNYNCTFWGNDLSDFSKYDLNFTDSTTGWMYIFRLCNRVQDSACRQDTTANNSMVCQRQPSGTQAYSLAEYTPGTQTVTSPSSGVVNITTTNGESTSCNFKRITTVIFRCNPNMDTSQRPGRIISVTELTSCRYTIVIETPQVCPVDCNWQGLDFSPMRRQQFYFHTTNWIYIFRMCGRVTEQACRQDDTASESMVCQISTNPSDTEALSIAPYIPIKELPWQNTSTGYEFTVFRGESTYCANGLTRQVTVHFVCDPFTSYYGYPVSASERNTLCQYDLYVNTSLVCSSQYNPAPRCEFLGYKLGPLSSLDLTQRNDPAYPPNCWVHFRMCGVVSNPVCQLDASTKNAMLCQQMFTHNDTKNLGSYDYSTLQWTRSADYTNAIQFVQWGENCDVAGRTRRTIVTFQCDRNVPFTGNVPASPVQFRESSTCIYELLVNTSLVCPTINNQVCLFSGYDLSTVGNRDLTVDAGGYRWYLRLCGTVAEPRCQDDENGSATNAMLCQVYDTDAVAAVQYDPNNIQTNAIFNGISFSLANGETCGANPRQTEIRIFCDPYASSNADNKLIYVAEPQTCNYVATVLTRQVCGAPWNTQPNFCKFRPTGGSITYDLSPLSYVDLTIPQYFNGSEWWSIYLRMCGIVQNILCHQDDTSVNSMLCQQYQQNPADNIAIAEYNMADSSWATTSIDHGIQIYIENGEGCGGRPRRSQINVLCDQNLHYSPQYPGYLATFDEPETCLYTMNLHTDLVCEGTTSVPPGTYTPPGDSSSSSGIGTGPILGIIFAIIVAVALLGYGGWKVYQKYLSGDLSTSSIYARSQGLLGDDYRGSRSDNMEPSGYQPPKGRLGF